MYFSSSNLINVLRVEETLSKATILNTFYFLSDNHTPAGKLIIFMAKGDEPYVGMLLFLFIYYVFACLSNWFSMFSFIIISKIYLSACF